MALIDQITAQFQALLIDGTGALTITSSDFTSDYMNAFFSKVLLLNSLTISNAEQQVGDNSIIVKGKTDLFRYTDIDIIISFEAEDDIVFGKIEGTFDPAREVSLPLISWIAIASISLSKTISENFELVQFTFNAEIKLEGSPGNIPVEIKQLGSGNWALNIAEETNQGITGEQLVTLLGSQALANFLPTSLVDVLDGFSVNGIQALFNTDQSTVDFFTLGISVTNGWEIVASKIVLQPGLHIQLSLINATDDDSRELIAAIQGTFSINNVDIPILISSGLGASTNLSFGLQPGATVVLPSFSDLLELAGEQDFLDSLPEGLKDIPQIQIDKLLVQYDPAESELTVLSFEVQTEENWPIVPNYFELEKLSINFDIYDLNVPASRQILGNLYGLFKIDDVELMCSIQKTPDNPDWTITAGIAPGATIDFTKIAAGLFEGLISIPDEFPDISFSVLSIAVTPATKVFSLQAECDDPIEISNDFSIEQFQLEFTRDPANAPSTISGNVMLSFEIKDIPIVLRAALGDAEGGWQFEGSLGAGHSLSLSELITDLTSKFGTITLPSALDDFSISDIDISYNTQTKDFSFSIQGHLTRPFEADATIIINLKKKASGDYEKYFSGALTIGDTPNQRTFDLIFDQQSQAASSISSSKLIALYQKPDGDTLQIGTLVEDVIGNADVVEALNSLTFTLKNALLLFEKDSGGGAPGNKYLFTVDVDFGVDLSGLGDLPIIGQQLVGKGPLKLAFQPIVDNFGSADLTPIKALLPEGSPSIPENLNGDFALSTTITFGDFNKVINLGMSSDDMQAATQQENADNLPDLNAADGTPDAGNTGNQQTTDVNKNFGALSISSLNLAYTAGTIELGIDGQLKIGPLELALFGLGATYTIQGSVFSAKLDGMVLDFEKPPLTIAGGFFRIDRPDSPPDYVGELNLQMEEFGLLVLGAFSQMADGQPSMFLYIFVDVPLGGPVFFFVEGLAFGFGYNRKLDVPPIDKMYNFPLVSDALGTSPQSPGATGSGSPMAKAELLRQKFELLADYIYPEEGQYFLAVGLKFNSFKIINCFALLTIGFGEEFDIAIMGLARFTTPPEAPIATANVEMAFSVRFIPAEGFIGANGILTPNTYVYSPLVRLEGGFALYAWMKGEHEGDFVVSIGGYHPAFDVPDYYPSRAAVPRVSLGWKLSDFITIKGEIYFALTPKAMMAGGALIASFTTSPDVHSDQDSSQSADGNDDSDDDDRTLDIEASFTAGVDFMIFWEPFHYEADAYIEIYAKATLNTFLGSFSASLSAGADVSIWGPDFAGSAEVKAKVLGVKVHFEVDFGASDNTPKEKVSWDTFATKFLPPTYKSDALSLTIQQGLVKTIKEADRPDGGTGDLWIINPKDLKLAVSSIFPITEDGTNIYATPVAGLAAPIRNQQGQVISQPPAPITFTITPTTKLDDEKVSVFRFIPQSKNYPQSLWTKDGSYASAQPGINGDQTISTDGGYTIVPIDPPKASETHSFHVSNLSYEEPPGPLPLNILPPADFRYEPLAEADAEAIDPRDAEAATKRSDLLNDMQFDAALEVQFKPNPMDMFTERPDLFIYVSTS